MDTVVEGDVWVFLELIFRGVEVVVMFSFGGGVVEDGVETREVETRELGKLVR